jgi:hypothetical protein
VKNVLNYTGFVFLAVLGSGCFDQPEFSSIPAIELEDIYFGETPDFIDADSIVVRLSFKDGNGDLGLTEDDVSEPYNARDFFTGDNGKLLTVRSIETPPVPPYEAPFTCINYTTTSDSLTFLSTALDNTYNITDTIFFQGDTYYTIADTVYFERNPNHYNITVQYFVKENGVFEEFNWLTDVPNQGSNCGETFDGRFGRFSNDGNASEGIISYSMKSIGFTALFSVKPLKLKITIKDRALNISNVVETDEFTLASIKR